MRRISVQPRDNWQERCDELGFTFHSLPSEEGLPYWNESAAYEFSVDDIATIEDTTKELFERCLDAAEFIVRNERYEEFGIPKPYWDAVGTSWDIDEPNVYQRFDLAYNGNEPAKMLEINADTPTSLIESSVAQWFWMKEVMGEDYDQFNSIHEQLVEQWKFLREDCWKLPEGSRLHFATLHSDAEGELIVEDFDNTAYMAETAEQAGFAPKLTFIEDIGWDEERGQFVDHDNEPINHIFKLYPWEWLANEQFGDKLLATSDKTKWVEPLWKMLLSNKQLLVVLHELFPNHPNILPAYNQPQPFIGNQPFVKKPKLSREGANVEIYDAQGTLITANDGDYGDEGHVYQAVASLPKYDKRYALIGSWVIGREPAGIDIRETSGLVTGDLAFIVPHYIK